MVVQLGDSSSFLHPLASNRATTAGEGSKGGYVVRSRTDRIAPIHKLVRPGQVIAKVGEK